MTSATFTPGAPLIGPQIGPQLQPQFGPQIGPQGIFGGLVQGGIGQHPALNHPGLLNQAWPQQMVGQHHLQHLLQHQQQQYNPYGQQQVWPGQDPHSQAQQVIQQQVVAQLIAQQIQLQSVLAQQALAQQIAAQQQLAAQQQIAAQQQVQRQMQQQVPFGPYAGVN